MCPGEEGGAGAAGPSPTTPRPSSSPPWAWELACHIPLCPPPPSCLCPLRLLGLPLPCSAGLLRASLTRHGACCPSHQDSRQGVSSGAWSQPPSLASPQDLDCFVIDDNGFVLVSERPQEVRRQGSIPQPQPVSRLTAPGSSPAQSPAEPRESGVSS